ncbi:MAG: hypothetical protein FGM46_02100 [Ferruginibacter sp.]|nr:hypothetical protein [Ferruginibacter sp.]
MNTFDKLEELSNHLRKYIDNRMSYTKLVLAERVSNIFSKIFSQLIFIIFIILFLLFAGISLALFLISLTGAYYWGFMIVASIFLAIGLIVLIFRKPLFQKPVTNIILKEILNSEENEED